MRGDGRRRRRALLLVLAAAAGIALLVPPVRRAADEARRALLRRWHRPSAGELLPADRVTARRGLLSDRAGAAASGDLAEVARIDALLAQEALQRAARTLAAWDGVRDPETGLLPRKLEPEQLFWNAEDCGADLDPHVLLAAHLLAPERERRWRDVFAHQNARWGTMPQTIAFRPARVVPETPDEQTFGAAELAKDGLLAITERLGRDGPWFERLEEITATLIAGADVESKFGPVFASTSEVNGDMLQVLARLHLATGEQRYIEAAERVADAYLLDLCPRNHGLPPAVWDFERGRAVESRFQLRDHGNEIIPGLAELYLAEKLSGRPAAERHREPLRRLLVRLLTTGRTADGLWYNQVDPETERPLHEGVTDTWGYVLNAYATYDLAEGTNDFAAEIERGMRAAASRKSFRWEGPRQDGYADSIESMLYLLRWYDVPEGRAWVDDEAEVFFALQRPDGFVGATYLDGNFIRTALLYALYKTQGVTAAPWRADVRLGAVREGRDAEVLHLYLDAEAPWTGVLAFDTPRHRSVWNLPFDYPRLNASPEWFVVEPEASYVIRNPDTRWEDTREGRALAGGMAVEAGGGRAPLRLTVSRSSPAGESEPDDRR